ncbi:proline-rich protein 2-like [Melopsittacus undulatus]|uniref:proline-rich protein 2-like n=1 Tax=Melopsittacus undulatus TaxID=13146 RepID=UPI00146D8038|nr:proline-rich protein 2-like [Melopsittacus undulatus]
MPGFATLPPARPSLFAPGPQGRSRRQQSRPWPRPPEPGRPAVLADRRAPAPRSEEPRGGTGAAPLQRMPGFATLPPARPSLFAPAPQGHCRRQQGQTRPRQPRPVRTTGPPECPDPRPGLNSQEGALVLRLLSVLLSSQHCPLPAPPSSPPPHRAIAVGNKAQHDPGRSGPASLQACPNARQPRPGPNSHEGDWCCASSAHAWLRNAAPRSRLTLRPQPTGPLQSATSPPRPRPLGPGRPAGPPKGRATAPGPEEPQGVTGAVPLQRTPGFSTLPPARR